MSAPCCKQRIEIHTDPKNAEYVIVSGAKKKAEAFLKVGEYSQIATKDIAETAALMQVNQMLFNLDETTIK